MIRYSKSAWDLGTLLQWHGSAAPRALPFSIVAAVLAALVQVFAPRVLERLWISPHPMNAFAFVAGFMIVFRCGTCQDVASRVLSCLHQDAWLK